MVVLLVLATAACTSSDAPVDASSSPTASRVARRAHPHRAVDGRCRVPGGADGGDPPGSVPRRAGGDVPTRRRRVDRRDPGPGRRRDAGRGDATGRDDQRARRRRPHGRLAAGQPGCRPSVPGPSLGVPGRGVRDGRPRPQRGPRRRPRAEGRRHPDRQGVRTARSRRSPRHTVQPPRGAHGVPHQRGGPDRPRHRGRRRHDDARRRDDGG